MTAQELYALVQKFADLKSDVIIEKNELLAEMHGEQLSIKLKMEGGILYCDEDGEKIQADRWVEKRLARLDLLADRILEFIGIDDCIIPVKGLLVNVLDTDERESREEVNDVVESLKKILTDLPVGTTNILYLTSDAGEGKTSVIESLARKQAEAYKNGKAKWLLLPVSLGGRPFLRLDEVITGSLINRFRFRYLYYDALLEMVKRGLVVLALDGFEEMFVQTEAGEIVSSLGNLVSKLDSEGKLLFAARKAFYNYSNLQAQTKLFESIRDKNVSFAELQLQRWSENEFHNFCTISGMDREFAEKAYKSFADHLGNDHPVLTRAVLVRKLVENIIESGDLSVVQSDLDLKRGEPEKTFERFLESIVKREVGKWIDQAGEIAKPLLNFDEHMTLLMNIAEEMWTLSTDILKKEIIETLAELFAEDSGKKPATIRQVRERICQHALIRDMGAGKEFMFDHEEFRSYFLGRKIRELLVWDLHSPSLEKILSMKPLSDMSLRVASDLTENISSEKVLRIINMLLEMGQKGIKSSYLRQSAALLALNLCSQCNVGDIVFLNCNFGPDALRDHNLENITFEKCLFERTSLVKARLKQVTFLECQMNVLEFDSNWDCNEVYLDKSSIPYTLSIISEGEGEQTVFAPVEKAKILKKAGFLISEDLLESFETYEEDRRIKVVEKALRVFRRSTAVNENVLRTKFGNKWQEFEAQILSQLLSKKIFKEVPYRGAGNQRRFRLQIPLDAFENARLKCGGDYDKLLKILSS